MTRGRFPAQRSAFEEEQVRVVAGFQPECLTGVDQPRRGLARRGWMLSPPFVQIQSVVMEDQAPSVFSADCGVALQHGENLYVCLQLNHWQGRAQLGVRGLAAGVPRADGLADHHEVGLASRSLNVHSRPICDEPDAVTNNIAAANQRHIMGWILRGTSGAVNARAIGFFSTRSPRFSADARSQGASEHGERARAGEFVLMELEINEPFLYIGSSNGAATRFAEAIVRSTAYLASR